MTNEQSNGTPRLSSQAERKRVLRRAIATVYHARQSAGSGQPMPAEKLRLVCDAAIAALAAEFPTDFAAAIAEDADSALTPYVRRAHRATDQEDP